MNFDTALLLPLAPVVVLAALLIGWSLVDIARRPTVNHLPKWAWALIVLLVTPLGPILYLVMGREKRRVLRDEDL
ncbi:PLD nuclease N-terminal domain-containing protein [Rhodoglobus sp. NPDC076762]